MSEGASALGRADDAPETLGDQGSYCGAFAGGKLPRLGQGPSKILTGVFTSRYVSSEAIEVSRAAAAGSALLARDGGLRGSMRGNEVKRAK